MKNDTFAGIIDTMTGECLAARIRLLNRTVTSIFDEALRPLGIKVSQLNMLMVVAKRGPISPGELAQFLNMEKSTVSRNVSRMRAHNWLSVSEGESGGTQILELGSPGRKLIIKSLPFWKKAQAKTEEVLGEQCACSIHRAGDTVWAQNKF